ncbi:aromatic alcohol reductase [Paraburkholderia megapolitana]|uniref:NmrA-like family protein n=1 Tax=Paraburkholderia megapolitana TaxID=420953 RepID=A0A1I3EHW6_9BURK|nr:aromatic alcohol reductase [Paraburkholderia megapolitana]QDQ80091.1 aromatic alcohol reductase [Paraburkholderia megapolitana]SFH98463.1 NmrA-like family protein [Paraburkholderia megapolitana]
MSRNQTILVLGAGELGMAVLRNLVRRADLDASISIAVLLRPSTIDSSDAVKQKDIAELRALGVELVPGDLAKQSVSALADIFARFDTIISCSGFAGGQDTQRKITQAVLDAGVKRYVPWQFGVDYDVIGRGSAQDLFDEQLDVRDLLRSQEQTQWIIVSTGMFTSFLFEPSFGVVDLAGNVVHALGSWDNAVTVTTAEDIGALTSAIVFSEPAIVNQVVRVAGDTVTYRQLADTVDRLLGLNLRRTEWSVPELRRQLAEDPHDAIRKYRVVFAEGCGVSWDKKQTFNAQRGMTVCGLEDWVRENLQSGDGVPA